MPEAGGRDVIRAALGAGGLDGQVTDMLEAASEPAPEGWRDALGFGLAVLSELPRAKVSVAPGAVGVVAVADSDPERAALVGPARARGARRRRARPRHLRAAAGDRALRLRRQPRRRRPRHRGVQRRQRRRPSARITAAARGAGFAGEAPCAVGLGAPSPDWAVAVEKGLAALSELGGGRFVLRDLSAELTAPDATPPDRLKAASETLDRALPDVFQLATVVPPRMETTAEGGQVYAPEFAATLDGDGAVRLTGSVKDAASRTAIASVAASLFGHDRVLDETALDPALPDGWPGRVLAGVEALASLEQGRMTVTPATVSVEGWGIEPGLGARVQAQLDAKVGRPGAQVDVAFNATAARAAALAARPRPEICAEQIAAILDAGSIRFGKGSADIVPESRGVIAAIADVLRGCPGAEFEIAGHTDSQGNAEANQALSEARAEAVVAALEASDLPLIRLHAHGYGSERPIGDNATDAGRAAEPPDRVRARAAGRLRPRPREPAAGIGGGPAPTLDPATATCAADVAAILGGASIQFAAGSATITADSRPTIERLSEALEGCPTPPSRSGGTPTRKAPTRETSGLSEERARAVVAALRTDALPLLAMTAKGYGESEPVADNDTEEGRAANRRIAFTLPGLAAAAEAGAEAEAEADARRQAGADTEATGSGDEESLVAQSQSGDPTEVCLARLDAILSENTIEFAPGSATITPESAPVVNAIAGVLRGCPDAALEVGGHTDSSGSDSGNLALSQQRADAVLAAVRRSDLPLPGLAAKGYGEGQPLGDNGTAEGRAQNRRIAFTAGTGEGAANEDGSGDADGSE